jgi:hypothetical protein
MKKKYTKRIINSHVKAIMNVKAALDYFAMKVSNAYARQTTGTLSLNVVSFVLSVMRVLNRYLNPFNE